MKILFAAAPAVGHLRPVLAFLPAFAARGHVVAVAASRSISRGVVPRAVRCYAKEPESYPARRPAAASDADWDDVSRDMARLSYTGICRIARHFRPDVIIHDFSERGASLAAERLSLPHATVTAAADTVCAGYLDREARLLSPLRAELGLPADPGGASVAPLCLNMVHPGFYGEIPLQPSARFYRHPLSGRRRPRGPRQRGSRVPTVLITLGTTEWIDRPGFLRRLLADLETVPARLIALAPDSDRAGLTSLFPRAEIRGYSDVPRLLTGSDLLICHGGFSSSKEALALGVPLHITPFHSDQFFVADRTSRLGVAVALAAAQPPGRFAASALSALAQAPADHAWECAMQMAALPDLGCCVDDISGLLSGAASRPSDMAIEPPS